MRYLKVLADAVSMDGNPDNADPRERCILLLMGITADDRKELIVTKEGHHSSQEWWLGLFAKIGSKGLANPPAIVIAEEISHACWPAAVEVYPNIFRLTPTCDRGHEEAGKLVAAHVEPGEYKSTGPSSHLARNRRRSTARGVAEQ